MARDAAARPPGRANHRWLVLARLGGGVLLAALAAIAGDGFRWPQLFYLAAGIATLSGSVTWWGRSRRSLVALLFLVDAGWISLAIVAAGSLETGLTLLYPLVAFGAGLFVGGRTALALSLVAAGALVASVLGIPGGEVRPSWIATQALLVMVLGAASDRMQSLVVSQERALEHASRALARMRLDTDSIVQNLTSGVFSLDRSGRVAHVNRAAEETLGIKADGIRGKLASEALPRGLRPLLNVLGRALATGAAVQREEIEVEREGGRVPLGLATTILFGPEEELTGVVALFQDLTDIRQHEEQARRRDRLAAVGELAAGIAHEIRNSVLPISGSVQILAGELDLDGEQGKLFQVIERETENVERFVGALLSYTKTHSLEPGRTDLREVAEETARDAQLDQRRKVQVTVEGEEAWAWADVDQIRQAVRNLLMNAADAAGDEGRVVLRTGAEEQGGAWVEVEDDGPGIPVELQSRVSEPFYTTKAGGTGLGLAIVSRITEEHEGRLRYLSSDLGGARIRIELPRPGEASSPLPRAA